MARKTEHGQPTEAQERGGFTEFIRGMTWDEMADLAYKYLMSLPPDDGLRRAYWIVYPHASIRFGKDGLDACIEQLDGHLQRTGGKSEHGRPTEVSEHGQPTEVSKHGQPTEVSKHGQPTEVSKHGQPTGVGDLRRLRDLVSHLRELIPRGVQSQQWEYSNPTWVSTYHAIKRQVETIKASGDKNATKLAEEAMEAVNSLAGIFKSDLRRLVPLALGETERHSRPTTVSKYGRFTQVSNHGQPTLASKHG